MQINLYVTLFRMRLILLVFAWNDRGENYAERRKQAIQESKYLGGDMEHTHLVKGLDYALLEKVGIR